MSFVGADEVLVTEPVCPRKILYALIFCKSTLFVASNCEEKKLRIKNTYLNNLIKDSTFSLNKHLPSTI